MAKRHSQLHTQQSSSSPDSRLFPPHNAAIIINRERNRYYSDRLSFVAGNVKATYKIVNKLLDKEYGADKLPNGKSDSEIANDLKSFFHGKVAGIYNEIKENLNTCSTTEDQLGHPLVPDHDEKVCFFNFMTDESVAEVIRDSTWVQNHVRVTLFPPGFSSTVYLMNFYPLLP